MCKNKFVLLTLVVAGFLFTGCEWFFKGGNPPKISFNISDAEALGGTDSNTNRTASGARAADASKNSTLLKILEDGSLESAFSCEISDIADLEEERKKRMTHYGKLIDVFLPPKDSACTDVYLRFDEPTVFPVRDPNNKMHIVHWALSNLLCIHEDGTWTDILYDSPWDSEFMPIDSKRNIQITEDGSLFVLFREGAGWEYYIRKYDAPTKSVKEICRFGRTAPLMEETENWTDEEWQASDVYVRKMKISKDAKWAYIQVSQSQRKGYLHVVSLEDPSVFTDIVLDSTKELPIQPLYWDYDAIENKLYYLQITRDDSEAEDETSHIIYKADSDGKNPEIYKEECDFCSALFAVGKDTVLLNYGQASTSGYHDEVYIDAKTGEEAARIQLKDYMTSFDNYIIKDNAIYVCYEGGSYDYDLQCYEKNEIVRLSTEDGTVINYTDKLQERENIKVTSWSVGDSKLYITGLYEGNPISYGMNIDGIGTPQKVAEGQVFTCIGSLK